MKLLLSVTLVATVLFSSCHYINEKKIGGNGNIKKETRTADSFSGVDVSGAIELIIVQDSIRKIEIETDENLQQYIDVRTVGNELIIETKDGYNLESSHRVKAYVSSPVFNSISVSGACTVKSSNQISSDSPLRISISGASRVQLDARNPEIDGDLSGASELTLRGQARDVTLEASGSSQIEAFDLMAENAFVDLSGASNANVFASVKLRADASGASGVRYRGNAPSVQSDVSGAGFVRKD
jgi:hypothetical protein